MLICSLNNIAYIIEVWNHLCFLIIFLNIYTDYLFQDFLYLNILQDYKFSFYQFTASLLNKTIDFFQKIIKKIISEPVKMAHKSEVSFQKCSSITWFDIL